MNFGQNFKRYRGLILGMLVLSILFLLFFYWMEDKPLELITPIPAIKQEKTDLPLPADKVKTDRSRNRELTKKYVPISDPALSQLKEDALAAHQLCTKALEGILTNFELVDEKHPFYDKAPKVLDLVSILLSRVAGQRRDSAYIRALQELLPDEAPKYFATPELFYHALHELDSCRQDQMLDFFNTVLTVSRVKKWSEKDRLLLRDKLFTELVTIQQEVYNWNDVMLLIHLGGRMRENGLIGALFDEHFAFLEEELWRERDNILEVLDSTTMSNQEKWQALALYVKRMQELSKEFLHTLERISDEDKPQ